MKFLLSIDDTVTPAGPGVEVRVVTDPPSQPDDQSQTQAEQLGRLALTTVHMAIEVAKSMSDLAAKANEAMAIAKTN